MIRDTSIETNWAIDQLIAIGYLSIKGSESVSLTRKGIQKALELSMSIPIMDRILLILFYHDLPLEEDNE